MITRRDLYVVFASPFILFNIANIIELLCSGNFKLLVDGSKYYPVSLLYGTQSIL